VGGVGAIALEVGWGLKLPGERRGALLLKHGGGRLGGIGADLGERPTDARVAGTHGAGCRVRRGSLQTGKHSMVR
jgi:hypothetical protein